jgi:hypothetical protein
MNYPGEIKQKKQKLHKNINMAFIIKPKLIVFIIVTFLLLPRSVKSHELNHTYVFLSIYEEKIEGRFEFTIADINRELGSNLNEELVEKEVFPLIPKIQNFLLSKVLFGSEEKNYTLKFTETDFLPLEEEADNIVLHFTLEGITEIPDNLDITYNLFFDNNSISKGMLVIQHNWKAGIIANHVGIAEVFTKGDTSKTISLKDASIWKGFFAMVKLGVWHIWIGLDHILFLLALILPSAVRRRKETSLGIEEKQINKWIPVAKFKPAFLYIIGIVTSFTIAHTITLSVAAIGIINLPSRYVESIIALSIAVAAFHNIRPLFSTKEWIIAFVFGLFHGFGFASVLGDKGLSGEFISYSLIGFNLGVEIGQAFIVLAIFPILFFIRKSKIYPKILYYGSILLIIISLHWVIERLFEFNIPLGRFLDSFL